MIYEKIFELSPVLPFRLDITAWALRRRAKNLIDNWNGHSYIRIIVINNTPIRCQVTQIDHTLEVTIMSHAPLKNEASVVAGTLEKMLGLSVNMEKFYSLSKNNMQLQALAKLFIGVKPPRFSSIFEALLNAIACQQVTLDLGILLLNRLSEKYGRKFEYKDHVQYAFPNPEDLQTASEEEIKKLGFSYQKARAITQITQRVQADSKLFTPLENMTNEAASGFLTKLRGIGRWSSEYVLLRGLGRLDIFPGDDVGAQNNLQRIFQLETKPDYEEIKKLTSLWQPFAGLVYFHLLLEKLKGKGAL